MMATLPQTSTPALPSLLAALAPAQAVGTGEGGAFEQLVAQQAPSAAVVTAPVLSAVPAAGAPAPLAVVDAPSAQPTPVVAAPGKPARPIAAEPELADADETSGEVPAPTADARPATDKAVIAANELACDARPLHRRRSQAGDCQAGRRSQGRKRNRRRG